MSLRTSLDNPFRRAEIIAIARRKGVADTEDLDRFLKAWFWHHPDSAYRRPAASLIDAARRMGRDNLSISEAQELVKASKQGRPLHKADDLGVYLRLTDAERTAWRIRTIGGYDFSKRQRTNRRKRQDRERKARQRLANGARPHSQSRSKLEPWKARKMSRTRWYELQKQEAEVAPPQSPKIIPFPKESERLARVVRADARGLRIVQIHAYRAAQK